MTKLNGQAGAHLELDLEAREAAVPRLIVGVGVWRWRRGLHWDVLGGFGSHLIGRVRGAR